MRTLKIVGAAVGAFVLSSLALAGPAQAAPGDAVWTANGDSSITSKHSVTLVGNNTSVEATNLGVDVEAGDAVSFSIALADGAACSGGAPRVFVVVNGINTNSWDQNIAASTQCGAEGTITFKIPAAGTIRQAGVVYDNLAAPGTVVVSDLRIAGELVDFQAVEPGPGPTKTPTAPPTSQPAEPRDCEAYVYTGTTQNLCADFPSPPGPVNCSDVKYRVTLVDVNNDPWGLDGNRGTPGIGCESNPLKPTTGSTEEPTADPTASTSDSPAPGAGGGLPVTGVNATALGGVGVIAVLAGVALVVARRRRVRFDA
ncbi:LPXTG cell wall anchor domain-containing protein [Micromonospora costi]|uniref:LPXTG cell wall anchor domain-containing protein n=1 Tax=Micromonospora costi TaxID=1530042 RepID=A0A3B0A3I1_9ACTN|nr:LPXTG cell wall anchor domain-containing protein [Micromonospora costi]RKN55358.1 LPXTG cell wall anchor domain-containing protein [Micromonospora costi]